MKKKDVEMIDLTIEVVERNAKAYEYLRKWREAAALWDVSVELTKAYRRSIDRREVED